MSASNQIEKKQQTVEQIIKSVTNADNFGACIYGPPGLGKSTLIRKTLTDQKIEYKDIPLHSSPIRAAKFISDNTKGILLYDDVADSKHPTHVAIQKALLAPDPITGQRVLRINTSEAVMKREGLPAETVFEGKIIFIMNADELRNDIHSNAMQSRIPYYKYDLSFEERLFLIKEMGKASDRYNLSKVQMSDLLMFLEDSAHAGISNFDLRLLGKAASIIQSSPDNWKLGVNSLMDADSRYRIIKQLFEMSDELKVPVSKRVELFTKATGQSRSTYFNLCRKFGFTNPAEFNGDGRGLTKKSTSPADLDAIHTSLVLPVESRHDVEVSIEN